MKENMECFLMQTDKCVTAHRGPGSGLVLEARCAGRREAPLFRIIASPLGEGHAGPQLFLLLIL